MENKEYVRFSTDIEQIPEDFDRYMEKINKDIKDYIKAAKEKSDVSYHTRDAHAKGYVGLKAEFRILDNLPEELAQGIYAKPGTHEAVIRISNGSSRVTADKLSGLAQGLAIKVFDVPGKKLAPGEEDSPNIDFNLINNPIFFCNSPEHYVFISKLFLKLNDYFAKGAWGKMEFAYNWATEMGKAFPGRDTLKELKALTTFQNIEPKNSLLYDYYSMGAVRHGDYIAKIRAQPNGEYVKKILNEEVDLESADEVLRPALLEEIRNHDFMFDIQIQLCKDLEKQPVEELTKEWSQELSPFRTVARLYIPQQEVPEDGNFEIMENLSFTPFRIIEENRPMGSLQMTRKSAYETSSKLRHKLNNKKRAEPKDLKEAFDKEFYKS